MRTIGLIVVLTSLIGSLVVHGSDSLAQLTLTKKVPLPGQTMLDNRTVPLLASDKKAGFISSVSDGSVISFSTVSGKVLSSIVVGQSAAVLSMLELPDRRLLAAPTVNAPDQRRPATISVIDATNPRGLNFVVLLVLPATARITTSSEALFTSDGQFVVIASNADEPALYCFSVATGQIVSQSALIGAPSRIALYQPEEASSGPVAVAVVSEAANTLSLMGLDQSGNLTDAGSFTPPQGSQFDGANNPVFSTDGERLFIATAKGQMLFAVNSVSGAILANTQVSPSPERIALADGADGDVLALTCISTSTGTAAPGVVVLGWNNGQFSIKSEFSPPPPAEFSVNNNVALSQDGTVGFVGSKSGELFAFGTETGALQSHQEIGPEVMGVGLGQEQQVVAALHRTSSGDEIVVASFDETDDSATPPDASDDDTAKAADSAATAGEIFDAKKKQPPVINRIIPDTVVMSPKSRVLVVVRGDHFAAAAVGLYNSIKAPTTVLTDGKLQMGIPADAFAQAGSISIQVRDANGLSAPVVLSVVASKPGPIATKITPDAVEQGRDRSLDLRVRGENFGPASEVLYNGTEVAKTTVLSTKALQAELPEKLFAEAGTISIQVQNKDGSMSPAIDFMVLSTTVPIIREVDPSQLDGPHHPFELKVKGSNFKENSVIQVQNKILKTSFVDASFLKATVPASLSRTVGTLNVVVIDKKGTGNSSNTETVTLLGPQISEIDVRKTPLLAGDGRFRMEIKGKNFSRYANVLINGSEVPHGHVKRVNQERLKVIVPSNLNQMAGQIPVIVRNHDGAESTPSSFTAVGPEITSFKPAQIIAGETDVHLEILGEDFRQGFGLLITPSGGSAMQIDTKFIRFVSRHKVIVKLEGKLNSLLSQPTSLGIQVVNPNTTTGIASTSAPLTVAGPQITAAALATDKSATSADELTITGTAFRDGAVVDFVKSGQVVMERIPSLTRPDKIVLTIGKGKVNALGQFQVEVVNPGSIASNAVTPSS
ncbi:MAG TPA: hypothetical protein VI756_15665 [Blastocatellia bacterium]